jgi:hypothetical protein
VGIEPLPAVRVDEEPTTAPPAAAPATTAIGVPAEGGPSTPQLEEEVEQAYRRYWELYSEALYTLDTSRVGQVAANEELRRIEDEVSGFRARARAVRVDVSHSYLIVDVTDAGATVYDEITDRSFLIDPGTKEPSRGPDTAHLVKDIFYFRKVDGAWKVTRSLRQEG